MCRSVSGQFRSLGTTFEGTGVGAEGRREEQKPVLNRCYSLCQQMMHFFHQFLLYTTFEVLEPLWHTLQAHIRSSTTVDQVRLHP